MKRSVFFLIVAALRDLSLKMKMIFGVSVFLFVLVTALRLMSPVVLAWLTAAILEQDSRWLGLGLLYGCLFFLVRFLEELRFMSYVIFQDQVHRNIVLKVIKGFFTLGFAQVSKKASSEHIKAVDRGLGGLLDVMYCATFSLLPVVVEAGVAVLIISLKVSFWIGGGCALLIISFVLLTHVISKRIKTLQEKWYETSTRNFKVLSESLRSYELIRSFRVTSWVHKRYGECMDRYISEVRDSLRPHISLGLIQGLLVMALMLSLSWMIYMHEGSAAEKVAQLVLVGGLLLQISSPLLEFSSYYGYFVKGLSSAHELVELMELPVVPEKHALGESSQKNLLYSFKNLSVTFKGAEVLQCDHLEVPWVRFLAVRGVSGAGKTTLAKVMSGLLEYSGEVLCGYSVEEVYYCSQNVEIFDLSLSDNITLGKPVSGQRLLEVLREAGFSSAEITALTERPLGEYGSRVSGGQRKRIGIARMLFHGAKVMVFDEPTAELDSQVAEAVMKTLRALSRDSEERVVVVITHDESLLAQCEAEMVLGHGQVGLKKV